MKLPFSLEEFLKVFEEYNLAMWPIQVLFYALAIVSIISILKWKSQSDRIVYSILAFFWFWMGIVYHIVYFSPINKAAFVFGVIFIAQGIIFLYFGTIKRKTQFEFNFDFSGTIGIIAILYALIVYPVLGYVLGHVFPRTPTFGVPCPTTIFTFGILLFSSNRIPWYMITVPFLWSLIGFSAAVNLSVWEDFGLVIVGVAATIILVFYKPKSLS